uniref:Uncharacterized protein n=1 Tax=Arundo donax TaxID=35708 RepID=A0A0A9HPX6_ARUDO
MEAFPVNEHQCTEKEKNVKHVKLNENMNP